MTSNERITSTLEYVAARVIFVNEVGMNRYDRMIDWLNVVDVIL